MQEFALSIDGGWQRARTDKTCDKRQRSKTRKARGMKAQQSAAGDGAPTDVQAISKEIFDTLGSGRSLAPLSDNDPGLSLDDAYRIAAAVKVRREARGERALGRKIGFTNRTIWAEYNVHAPIWGFVYDSTVAHLPEGGASFSLRGLSEPRIEPEIVFGLAAAPTPDMNENALFGCIEWVTHGFEIVQSIYPNWKFLAADTIAAFGLHGALWIGPRHRVRPRRGEWPRELSSFEIDLFCDGSLVDHGRAANVLDGPLFALKHLVAELARHAINCPLVAGEIVTTGTLTRAFPVVAGQTWTTALHGVPLEGARIQFIA
jgi:2-oxo-3-hexenedioate decarboxylase